MAGAIVAVLGFTLSMAFRRRWRWRTDGIAFYAIMLALMTPGFLVGLGNQLLWKAMGETPSLWQTALGANVIWGIPFAFLVMLAVWNRYDKRVEEAARDLGADQKTTFREVTLPLVWTGIFGSFLFGFTLTWNDYDRTILLQNGYETQTLPLQIGGMTSSQAIRPEPLRPRGGDDGGVPAGDRPAAARRLVRLRFRTAPVHRVAEEFGDTVGLGEQEGRQAARGVGRARGERPPAGVRRVSRTLRRALAAGVLLLAIVPPSAGARPAGPLRGPEVDVSRVPGAQVEPAIAVDPLHDQVLLAGSNSFREGSMRVYSSVDGGISWTSSFVYPAPASFLTTCASDPGVAIDLPGGSTSRSSGRRRAGAAGRSSSWPRAPARTPRGGRRSSSTRSGPRCRTTSPRSPSTHLPRVHTGIVSTRSGRGCHVTACSASCSARAGDGGRTWTRIVKVNRSGSEETYASVATARNGTVYVVWDDPTTFSLKIARSTDGGVHFEPEQSFITFSIVPIPSCGSGIVIPASLRVCLHANPIVSVDRSGGPRSGRVYVSYTKTDSGGDEGVYVKAFDSRLRPLLGGPHDDGVAVAPAPRRTRPGPVLARVGGRPVDRFAVGVLLLHGRRPRPEAGVLQLRGLARRRQEVDSSRPRRLGRLGRDLGGRRLRQYGDYEGLAVANGVAHPVWTDSRDLLDAERGDLHDRLTVADFGLSG